MKPLILAAPLVLWLAACATVPPPTDALSAAELAVQRADVSRVDDPSSPELKSARSKLAAARAAVAQREMLQATRLAEEAKLDADLAGTRSEAARYQFTVEAVTKSNEALRQQALRNAVDVAPIAIPAAISPAEPADEPTTNQ